MKRSFKKVFMISMLACMACTFVFAKGKKDKAAEEPTVVETEKEPIDMNDPGWAK